VNDTSEYAWDYFKPEVGRPPASAYIPGELRVAEIPPFRSYIRAFEKDMKELHQF